MNNPFRTYLQALQADLARGDASEHTHRPALKTLLEALEQGITATNEPKKYTDCGKPDMRVFRGPVPLGSLETKDIGKNLDAEERTKQLKDYLQGLPNFILTDYLEFRWYVNGENRAVASLGTVEREGKIRAKKEALAVVGDLLVQFLALKLPSIGTAKELALRMAKLAGMMHNAALKTLEMEPATGTLKSWLAAFEKTLVPNLSPEEFSDMYAQTLTYGLFAAKVSIGAGQDLRRDTAAGLLPETNPFLKRLFYHLAGPEFPPTVSWVVDDMVSLLNSADLEAVMTDFGRGSLEKDPVIHFYETFLAAYDPEKRKVRGVYYTPEPVVSYIVRAIDYLLKERFGRPWGLADSNTLILDPVCGTGTFLHSAIALIYDYMCNQGQAGGWDAYVSQSLLSRIFGFELLMAPYAVAHLKLALLLKEQLKEQGFDFPSGQRLGVYLTNTLDEGFKKAEVLTLAGFITDESNQAVRIKKEDPIEVVLGNPPYAGHSANLSRRWQFRKKTKKGKEIGTWVITFIGQLIEDYKWVDGKPLREKNPKWLQDDYVKFIRWGQWRITQTGRGVLAMITNHGYLDNPTFRGMRQQLMQTFNEIYLLNLHGNAKKKEVCPDGSKDQNVFDIQQGVAIGLFVKDPCSPIPARVNYADLWGLRKGKEKALAELDLFSTPWRELLPNSPFYLFVPQDTDLRAEYDRGLPVNEIFPVNSVGLFTARDNLTIHWSTDEVWDTVRDFIGIPEEEAREKYRLGPDVRDWKVKFAQADIRNSGPSPKDVVPLLYRPFDIRFTYYTGKSKGFMCMARPEVMGHMLELNNICLNIGRFGHAVSSNVWDIVFCSKQIIDLNLFRRGGSSNFPLYLNHLTKKIQKTFFDSIERNDFIYNLDSAFIKEITHKLNVSFSKEKRDRWNSLTGKDVFHYTYSVLHAPTYRKRYIEFLRIDYPRLPLTGNKGLFAALVSLGAELVSLHLMESPYLEKLITRFPVPGSRVVEGVRFQESARRVYINSEQYFEGVPPEVWAFTIGGYQVCHKWLKDRKGRTLTFEDIQHYQKIIVALAETIRLMGEIDAAIEAHGGWPIS